ncbi:MAG TPA: hypothetical protein VGE52_20115, partial [Pirellulales bacterium]
MNVGEAPSNWLSKIIERVRRSINRPRPHREHVLERDAILAAIQKHPNGAALIGYAKLPGAILSALAVADRVEQDK